MDIKINKEIMEYSEKVFFGLTGRQFILSVMGVTASVILFFVLPCPVDLKLIFSLLVTVPFALAAFMKIRGLPPEEYFKRKWNRLRTPPLIHGDENLYHHIYRRHSYEKMVIGATRLPLLRKGGKNESA